MAGAPPAPSYDSNTGYRAQNNITAPHPSYSNAAPPFPQQAHGNPYAQSQPMQYTQTPETQGPTGEKREETKKKKEKSKGSCWCECGDDGWNCCSLRGWIACCCCQCCCD